MADAPIPSPNFDDATNAAIIASGRNPSGAKRDGKGNPIEVGKGSRVQQTSQHIAALQKFEGRG